MARMMGRLLGPRVGLVAGGLGLLLGCGDDGGDGPSPLGLVEHDCVVALPEGFGPDDVRGGMTG